MTDDRAAEPRTPTAVAEPVPGGESAGATSTPTVAAFLPSPSVSHRDRLLDAMAQLIREQGFATVTVADVVARARTSRRTFYQHFEDREACFLALFDVLNEYVLGVITEAATGEQPWHERVDRTISAYLGTLAAEPALTQTFIRELPTAGDAGWQRAQRMKAQTADQLSRLINEAAEHDPTIHPLSPDAAAFIVGGFLEIAMRAFDADHSPLELRGLATDMVSRLTSRI